MYFHGIRSSEGLDLPKLMLFLGYGLTGDGSNLGGKFLSDRIS